ncbi:hypothetical protein J4Q44_G00005420, partial [Coregonus suidteri]
MFGVGFGEVSSLGVTNGSGLGDGSSLGVMVGSGFDVSSLGVNVGSGLGDVSSLRLTIGSGFGDGSSLGVTVGSGCGVVSSLGVIVVSGLDDVSDSFTFSSAVETSFVNFSLPLDSICSTVFTLSSLLLTFGSVGPTSFSGIFGTGSSSHSVVVLGIPAEILPSTVLSSCVVFTPESCGDLTCSHVSLVELLFSSAVISGDFMSFSVGSGRSSSCVVTALSASWNWSDSLCSFWSGFCSSAGALCSFRSTSFFSFDGLSFLLSSDTFLGSL